VQARSPTAADSSGVAAIIAQSFSTHTLQLLACAQQRLHHLLQQTQRGGNAALLLLLGQQQLLGCGAIQLSVMLLDAVTGDLQKSKQAGRQAVDQRNGTK
jgi:hypothetical protein